MFDDPSVDREVGSLLEVMHQERGQQGSPRRELKGAQLRFLYEGTQDSCSFQKTVVLGHISEGDRCVYLTPVWGEYGLGKGS